MVAVADLSRSTTDVARIVTVAGFGKAAGAVYRPALLTLPQSPTAQVRLHVTAAFALPVSMRRNWRALPIATLAALGHTSSATSEPSVTVAATDFVVSACAVAATVTVGGTGTMEGAVYSPVALTVPHAAPVQPAPVTAQVTAV